MMPNLPFDPTELVLTYGFWAIAIVIGLESMGIPLPGETVLIAAAIWAGATHHSIGQIVAAAVIGAVVGDSIGFWIGREVGLPLMLRYGDRVGITESRLKLGQYLFLRHGGKVVFFGRFVAILRTLAAFLAGANRMTWPRFLMFNAAGGTAWASLFGLGAYVFGAEMHRVSGPISIALLLIGLAAALVGFVFVRRHEQNLLAQAERALPGPVPRQGG